MVCAKLAASLNPPKGTGSNSANSLHANFYNIFQTINFWYWHQSSQDDLAYILKVISVVYMYMYM